MNCCTKTTLLLPHDSPQIRIASYSRIFSWSTTQLTACWIPYHFRYFSSSYTTNNYIGITSQGWWEALVVKGYNNTSRIDAPTRTAVHLCSKWSYKCLGLWVVLVKWFCQLFTSWHLAINHHTTDYWFH